jgi:hypothetical protein
MSAPIPILARAAFAVAAALVLAACASARTIPMVIQSDPLGADVIYQVRATDSSRSSDWIYLGKTPLEVNREHDKKRLGDSHTFVFRAFKEGYLDQTREWSGGALEDAWKDKGHLFWNPRLVPAGD